MSVRVRFAPSPTGYLHAGNARTALITWLFARHCGGHYLLRIDDTDTERSRPEYEDAIESGLRWLGIDWDEKARQRTRTDRYDAVIEKMMGSGRLYPCFETPEDLALKRKIQLSRGLPPIYDRSALTMTDAEVRAHEKEGRRPHWRFKLDHEAITWTDMVRGPVTFRGEAMSDPVVIREDGRPLYHLCSVIDDADYAMTHIVRGEDHVSNTAAHIQMFRAMGAEPPAFAHLPMISDKEGGKLSKRLGSMSLRELQENEGIEPMAINSLLARLGTSDPIEPFTTLAPLVETFDFSKFSKGAPKFDDDEMYRLNAKILHATDYTAIRDRLDAEGLGAVTEDFWNAVRPNIERLSDVAEWWRIASGAIDPAREEPEFLQTAAQCLPPEPWDAQTWSRWTDAVKEKTGRKGKALFLPLRKAITGMDHGPEMTLLLPLIGYEKIHARLTGSA